MYEGEGAMMAYDKSSIGSTKRMSYREEIELEVKALESRLEQKKKMLALLDANPAIEQFMDLSRG